MKNTKYVILVVMGFLFTSCLVKSIHPWYDNDTVIFEPKLLGQWINVEDEISMIFNKKGEKSYLVDYSEKGDTTIFKAHLTKIKDNYYLDYYPVVDIEEGLADMLLLKLHSLMKIDMTDEKISLYPVGYDWLETKAKAGELGDLKYQFVDDDLILISSTPVLREFVANNSHKNEFFDEPLTLTRQ